MWNLNCSLPWTKLLGIVACRVTYKILEIGDIERPWGDVNTNKSENNSYW